MKNLNVSKSEGFHAVRKIIKNIRNRICIMFQECDKSPRRSHLFNCINRNINLHRNSCRKFANRPFRTNSNCTSIQRVPNENTQSLNNLSLGSTNSQQVLTRSQQSVDKFLTIIDKIPASTDKSPTVDKIARIGPRTVTRSV